MDNKKDKSKDKNKAINDKLKKMVKLDLQKKLFFGKKNNSVFESFETQESNLQMTNNIGSYMVNFAMGNVKKWGKILAILVIGLVVVVNSISSGLSAVGSIVPSTPKVSEEDKKEILRLMKELDDACGKKLSEGYTLVGSKDTDWKAVLSIYFAYYNNDLVNKSTGTYMNMIEEASRKYGVDKWIIMGVISTESDWIMHQPNQYGACGWMQVTPVCARDMGFDYEKVKTDIYTNVMCGTKYLGKMFDMFGQTTLALAGYNAGPGNVQKFNGVPPFTETQNYVKRVTQRAEYYRTGVWEIPDGSVPLEVELNKIYNIVNEVIDAKTLKRRDFYSALSTLNYTKDQEMLATALYEADLWDITDDYSFKIVGSYSSSSILGDYGNLSIPRQEILSIAQQICDLNIYYLWGGREYDMNKPINQVKRMDCSGFTGYLMAKVFGTTYYNGTDTYHQINYCYEVPADQAIPGDIVFNHSLGHTLIYAGEKDGKRYFYHAPETGKVIQCSTYHNKITFHRLKNVDYDAVYERRW